MRYSDADLLEEIAEIAEELGHSPSIQEFRQYGDVSVTTYYNRFGSWNEAVEAAGYTPRDAQTKASKATLIESMQDLADELGKPPSAEDVDEHGEYWASTYRNRFGSWNDALEAAGFEPRTKGVTIPRDDLLEELSRLKDELGAPPTFRDMAEHGKFSPETYIRTFDSWNDALEAAGFTPSNIGADISDEELVAELRRLREQLGDKPTAREMDNKGRFGTATYQRHFGSWSAALEAAFDGDDEN